MDGKDKHDSISFDTNARKLLFRTISGNPTDVEGEGKVIAELGTIIDLSQIKSPGSGALIPGPTIGDLTGGDENRIHLTLAKPDDTAHLSDLITGRVTIAIALSDGGEIFHILTAAELVSLSIAQGNDDYKIDLSSVMDLSAHVGAHIFRVAYSVEELFTVSTGDIFEMYGSCSLGLDRAHDADLVQISTGSSVTITLVPTDEGPVVEDCYPGFILDGTILYLNFFEQFRLVNNPIEVYIPITAAAIQAASSSSQLAAQDLGHSVPPIMHFGADFLTPYSGLGLVITNIVCDTPVAYGPSLLAPLTAYLQFYLAITEDAPFIVSIANLPGIPIATIASTPSFPCSAEPVSGQEGLIVTADIYPKSTPSFNDITVTEPFEIRLRNNPAFKLRFTAPLWTDDNPAPLLNIYAFVSQGEVNHPSGSPINLSARYWTSIPMNILGSDQYTPMPSVKSPLEVIINNPITWLPNNFGQSMLIIPKEYIGPYDFIMFIIVPFVDEGGYSPDYSNCYLEIIANARELI